MVFYNYREMTSNQQIVACWCSDLSILIAGLSKRACYHELTLCYKNMPEFKGTPALDCFSYWTYTVVDSPKFQLCLRPDKFALSTRGILAEIRTDGTYQLTPLTCCGLFSSKIAEQEPPKKAATLEEATQAVEQEILEIIERVKQQLSAINSGNFVVTIEAT